MGLARSMILCKALAIYLPGATPADVVYRSYADGFREITLGKPLTATDKAFGFHASKTVMRTASTEYGHSEATIVLGRVCLERVVACEDDDMYVGLSMTLLDILSWEDALAERDTPTSAGVYVHGGLCLDAQGLLHSPDNATPAITSGEGEQRWYCHGRIHRDADLPAVVGPNGRGWFQHGSNCRPGSDGPLWVTRNDDAQLWYVPGTLAVTWGGFHGGILHRDGDKPAVITAYGRQQWHKHGRVHRDNGLPAVVDYNGAVMEWYKDGVPYREGGLPVVVHTSGSQLWKDTNNVLHRDGDLPAVIDADRSTLEWHVHGQRRREQEDLPAVICNGDHAYMEWHNAAGQLHRDDDKPAKVFESGTMMWFQAGKYHRDGDLPAVISSDGKQEWYQNGLRHRHHDQPAVLNPDGSRKWYKWNWKHRDGDLPADILPDGTQIWYKLGRKHRDNDLPAVILPDGTQEWYFLGDRHREGDLPAVVLPDGTQKWYKQGLLHRGGDLPAVILPDGTQEWYREGERSRLGLPAVILPDGTREWYMHGRKVLEGEYDPTRWTLTCSDRPGLQRRKEPYETYVPGEILSIYWVLGAAGSA